VDNNEFTNSLASILAQATASEGLNTQNYIRSLQTQYLIESGAIMRQATMAIHDINTMEGLTTAQQHVATAEVMNKMKEDLALLESIYESSPYWDPNWASNLPGADDGTGGGADDGTGGGGADDGTGGTDNNGNPGGLDGLDDTPGPGTTPPTVAQIEYLNATIADHTNWSTWEEALAFAPTWDNAQTGQYDWSDDIRFAMQHAAPIMEGWYVADLMNQFHGLVWNDVATVQFMAQYADPEWLDQAVYDNVVALNGGVDPWDVTDPGTGTGTGGNEPIYALPAGYETDVELVTALGGSGGPLLSWHLYNSNLDVQWEDLSYLVQNAALMTLDQHWADQVPEDSVYDIQTLMSMSWFEDAGQITHDAIDARLDELGWEAVQADDGSWNVVPLPGTDTTGPGIPPTWPGSPSGGIV
jgi:hypothetical protein